MLCGMGLVSCTHGAASGTRRTLIMLTSEIQIEWRSSYCIMKSPLIMISGCNRTRIRPSKSEAATVIKQERGYPQEKEY